MPTPDRTSLAEIVEAGRELLERDGIQGLTMQAVATQVGVRAPSLYKRVSNRDALVALVATLLTPLSVFGMATGRWIGPSVFWLSWHWRTWVYGGLAYLVLAWGYKAIMVKMGYPIH